MRPTTRHRTRSHRPRPKARTAGWRTSQPQYGDRGTERELRPAHFAHVLLASDYGRGLRMVAGGLLISLGASAGGGPVTTTLAAVGLATILEAMFGLFLAPPPTK